MKNFTKVLRLLALVAVIGFSMVVSGCATTSSINFAEQKQPEGVYKQAVINVSGFAGFFGNTSVLQRFYEKYPSTQYEVVAYEKTTKAWLPAAGAVGGALLGSGIAIPAMSASSDGSNDIMIIAVPIVAVIGAFTGYMLSTNYVVTYVERYPAALRAEG